MGRVERERDEATHDAATQALDVDAGRSRLTRASIEHATLLGLRARKRSGHDRSAVTRR